MLIFFFQNIKENYKSLLNCIKKTCVWFEYSERMRPSERKKGYATKMLSLSLSLVKQLGIKKALVTCDKINIASAKTILNNGGVLENEVIEEGEVTQRYWINIKL